MPVEALILDTPDNNPMLRAALDHCEKLIKSGQRKEVLRQFQCPPVFYACIGVKANKGITDTSTKETTARNAYKEVAVPGFLRWLEEDSQYKLPPWFTKEMFGRSTLEGKRDGEYITATAPQHSSNISILLRCEYKARRSVCLSPRTIPGNLAIGPRQQGMWVS